MSSHDAVFAHALQVELSKPHSASAKDAFRLGGFFTDILKKIIDSVGLGDLTKEEFLALVSSAFDVFTAGMQIPAMLKPILKALVLSIAGRIYDKRAKPKLVAAPMI